MKLLLPAGTPFGVPQSVPPPDIAAKRKLFVHDEVHLSPAGHELVTQTVLRAIGKE